ncbi:MULTISPECIES: NAD(P)H-binding protein [unclassified Pseudoclavibacter]|uniref:NAD(P)H-binding protein n=1 Tax=unclassified Pseudoclavibacter TaxID=2615177 RepID=UPI00130153FA|nr:MULTISPECIES: NAD(P)H-binding protein [unclassified Pseudoclavibacter]KAB1645778.1 NAD(P)H-binding protein [Pseudoclavibacter sp. CFCC 14310]KAB1664313.1 NAD(P)H-binding protein [Pseudoclavibacter sp. CFCC 13611]
MSTIAIVGGHGKIALLLTERLSSAGHTVLNVVRDARHEPDVLERGGTPLLADLEAANAVEHLTERFQNADAVVFAAGAGGGSGVARKHTVDYLGSVRSADAAVAAGVRRFVQISFIGAEQDELGLDDEVFTAYHHAKRDADRALQSRDDLDWTIVRPGRLTDDPACGSVALGTGFARRTAEGGASDSIARADVAALLQAVLDEPGTVGRAIDALEGTAAIAAAVAQLFGVSQSR